MVCELKKFFKWEDKPQTRTNLEYILIKDLYPEYKMNYYNERKAYNLIFKNWVRNLN